MGAHISMAERKVQDGPSRVLVVDDHSVVRHGLALLINNEHDLAVCGEASDAGSALKAVEKLRPDLIVVDIALGDTDGIELIKQINARWPTTKLLALSMHSENIYAERALKAGANGYLMKEEAPEEFLGALRQILSGEVFVSRRLEKRWLQRMRNGSHSLDRLPVETLTDRELAVLQLIGDGHPSREIAESLNLSIKTIQSHQEHIKQKLDLANATELVRFATLWVHRESGA